MQFQHRTRPSSSATYVAWGLGSTLPRTYCHPANEYWASHDDSAPRGFLQGRERPSAQSLPEKAGPYGSSFASTSVGSALHATHPVLAEAEGSLRGLVSRTPSHNGDSGLCISPGPLEGPPLAKAGRDLRHGVQKEGCHNRRFQQGLGSAVQRQTDLRSLVRRGVGSAHQLPRDASSVPCLSILPAGHKGTPYASAGRFIPNTGVYFYNDMNFLNTAIPVSFK